MRVLRELLLLGVLLTVALKAAEGCPDNHPHDNTYGPYSTGDGHGSPYTGEGHGSQYNGDGDGHGPQHNGDGRDWHYSGDGHGSQYPGDGHGSQYPGDGHGSQYPGDGHGGHYPGDGHGSQYPGDGHGSQYPGDGHGGHYPGDGHGCHYPGDGHGSQYPGDGHGGHYPGDGHGSQYPGDGHHGWYYPGNPYTHGPHYPGDACQSHYTGYPFFGPGYGYHHPTVKPPCTSIPPHHHHQGEQDFSSLLEKLLEILKGEKYILVKEVKDGLVKVLGVLLKEVRELLKEVKYDLLKELKECLAKELRDILKELKYELLKELKDCLVKELHDILKDLKDDLLQEVKDCLANELRDLLKEVKINILKEIKDLLLGEVKFALRVDIKRTLETELRDAFKNFSSCSTPTTPPPTTTPRTLPPTTTQIKSYPRDCRELYADGDRSRGVKTIYPDGANKPGGSIYCDNSVDGGGWTVFQHRTDAVTVRENFFRNWTDYQEGFGSLHGEFWMGLDKLHARTSASSQELRVDLENYEGAQKWAKYTLFTIGSASDNYVLNVGGYSGDAGDAMEVHKYREFSTVDMDHDTAPDTNCALKYAGAWWYQACHQANLNGMPHVAYNTGYGDGIGWYPWTSYNYSLKTTSMMIRPILVGG